MQVSRREASRALAVLRRAQRHTVARRRRRRGHPSRGVSPLTVDAAVGLADRSGRVRGEQVAAARARLAAGHDPSPEAVAEMMIRRAICDRLS